ncbi:unnamed protein product [Brassica napus]|uniref:(rape) hypothetical protein n=2 Tax=Brassica TaxID=3705 RepID=A0A816YCL3_BRANA|nr:unnamed protein product [Brassica napus]
MAGAADKLAWYLVITHTRCVSILLWKLFYSNIQICEFIENGKMESGRWQIR